MSSSGVGRPVVLRPLVSSAVSSPCAAVGALGVLVRISVVSPCGQQACLGLCVRAEHCEPGQVRRRLLLREQQLQRQGVLSRVRPGWWPQNSSGSQAKEPEKSQQVEGEATFHQQAEQVMVDRFHQVVIETGEITLRKGVRSYPSKKQQTKGIGLSHLRNSGFGGLIPPSNWPGLFPMLWDWLRNHANRSRILHWLIPIAVLAALVTVLFTVSPYDNTVTPSDQPPHRYDYQEYWDGR